MDLASARPAREERGRLLPAAVSGWITGRTGARSRLPLIVYWLVVVPILAAVLMLLAGINNRNTIGTVDVAVQASRLIEEAAGVERAMAAGDTAGENLYRLRLHQRLSAVGPALASRRDRSVAYARADLLLTQFSERLEQSSGALPPGASLAHMGDLRRSAGALVSKIMAAAEQDLIEQNHRLIRHVWITLALTVLILAIGLGLVVLTVKLLEARQRLSISASRDDLTGLFNRRSLIERIGRPQPDSALLVMDIDHFKQINDAFGHPVGDEVLRSAGALINRHLRRGERAGRFGGEEFVLCLPARPALQQVERARQIHRLLSAAIAMPDGTRHDIRWSMGLARASGRDTRFADLFKRADNAVYAAKLAGRDRLIIADDVR